MNIGIDCSLISAERAGVGQYCYQLVHALSRIDLKDQYVLYPVFYDFFFQNYAEADLPRTPNFRTAFSRIPPLPLKILWHYLPAGFKEYMLGNVDLVHSTTFASPNFGRRKKLVVTIYDLTFLTHPECHTEANIKHCLKGVNDAVKYADAIIAISNHTKDDLIKYLGIPEEMITVTHLAAGPDFYHVTDKAVLEAAGTKYKLPSGYVLFVGSLEPRKNIGTLLKSYSRLPERLQKDFHLVIAGGKGWLNSDIPKTVNDLKIGDKVHFAGFIDKDDLRAVYSQASVFVYPSFYEGFGLPILEAMACGAPVVCSNTSSMPEVAGDAAELASPTDANKLAGAIEYVLTNERAREDMRLKGLKHASLFSWEKCAGETIEVYRKVLNS